MARTKLQRGRGDAGAALVEFAIVFPVLVMLLMGTVTGGLAISRRASVNSAAREAARYGATVAQTQCNSSCGGMTWAQLVQSVAVQRATGDVTSVQVCAALVSGPGSAPVAVDSSHIVGAASGTNYCYVDNSSDTGLRVQVTISRPDEIQLVFAKVPVTLTAQATAKYEQ